MKLTFEWDEVKAIASFKKHKVSFDEGGGERRDKIRIISCRKATMSERRFYEKGDF